MSGSTDPKPPSDAKAERADRKLTETAREVARQRALVAAVPLSRPQLDFWETRYADRLLKMLDRSTKFREFDQSIRFVSALIGATVAALGGFVGTPIRAIVAALGVTLAAVNAAPSIFSTSLRVIINRRYVRQLLAEGWVFAFAVTGPDDDGASRSAAALGASFETFRVAVEGLLTAYDDAYESSIYEHSPGGTSGSGLPRPSGPGSAAGRFDSEVAETAGVHSARPSA